MVEGRLEEAELRFQEELKKERKERKEECEILREGLRHRGPPVRASDDTHITSHKCLSPPEWRKRRM